MTDATADLTIGTLVVAGLASFNGNVALGNNTGDTITVNGATNFAGDVTFAGDVESFPSGTKMLFYQTAAPTNWTIDTSVDDKFLRVTDTPAEGGTNGGTWDDLTHNHGGPSHTHTMGNHTHGDGDLYARVYYQSPDELYMDRVSESWTADWNADMSANTPGSVSTGVSYGVVVSGDTSGPSTNTTGSGGTGNTDNTNVTHGSSEHAYANVILATKD